MTIKGFVLTVSTCTFSALSISCLFLKLYTASIVGGIGLFLIAILAIILKPKREFSEYLRFKLC